jgi:glycosyltransferase-like protein
MTDGRRRLRIAILAHSTNPRGGVVHALGLGDALADLGHDVVVHAPDATGQGFFRPTRCATACIPASMVGGDTLALVRTRAGEYLDYFTPAARRDFDVWHAQDGISGNALADLRELGLIPGFVRTVHHVDDFSDARLAALQVRSIAAADSVLVVSRLWRDWLHRTLGCAACVIGNGVDTTRCSPQPDGNDAEVRSRFGLDARGPVFLSVGGVEARKNTLRILEAFAKIYQPGALLVIAGGASLLDHGAYRARFAAELAASGLPDGAVRVTGPLPDRLMPALYRAATALVFPSLTEGFGLVVLEAMASGVPVIVSRIAPFTEYLRNGDVVWCDPHDSGSIAAAMRLVRDIAQRDEMIQQSMQAVQAFTWDNVARAHLDAYAALLETEDA